MKLTELAIEGYGVCRDLRIGRLNPGLNVLFGETGSGKTTVRNFVRGILFGFDSQTNSGYRNEQSIAGGNLDVQFNNYDYRLLRDVRISGDLSLQPLSGTTAPSVYGVDQFTGNLSADLYDTFFNISFHDTKEQSFFVANALFFKLGVPRGQTGVRDEAAFLRWQEQTNAIKSRLSANQQRIDELTIEKRNYQQQLEHSKSLNAQQLAGIERELQQISLQLNSINTVPTENEMNSVRAEISRVRDFIANAEVQYVPTAPVAPIAPVVGAHQTLYQRLDEIDNQIRRWRRVQSDIQTQRVRLRDEMLVWNELTLDSDEHPYHNARGILVALESKVDHAENQLQTWNSTSSAGQQTSVNDLANLCRQMRDDIYGLCQELGHQYKHIRHKAAAAELKQLRRCYNEMGENTERLVKRRESVVAEIRQVDPAGAEAICRAGSSVLPMCTTRGVS